MRFVPATCGAALALLCLTTLFACGDSAAPGAGPTIANVVGDQQQAALGAELPETLSLRFLDAQGHPVVGGSAQWAVTSGGGSLVAGGTTQTSDAKGAVQAVWRLGSTEGIQQLRVVGPGDASHTFSASAATLHASAISSPALLCSLAAAGAVSCLDGPRGKLVPLGSPVPVAQLAASGETVCGLSTSGTIYCGGFYAQPDSALPPTVVPLAAVAGFPPVTGFGVSDHLGGSRLCGLTASGDAWCAVRAANTWPWNAPAVVPGGHTFSRIVVGNDFGCGLDAAGQLWCWGGALPGPTSRASDTPVQIGTRVGFTGITAGSSHVCVLDPDQTAWCLGFSSGGALGSTTVYTTDTLVAAVGGAHFTRILATDEVTVGVDLAGHAWAWGNFSGLIDATSNVARPLDTSIAVSQVGECDHLLCVLAASGAVYQYRLELQSGAVTAQGVGVY